MTDSTSNISPQTDAVAPTESSTPTDPPAASTNAGELWWRRAARGVNGFPALLLVLVGAGLAGLVDPGFGWNVKSLRLLAVFVLVFLVVNYTAALVKWLVGRRRTRRMRLVVRPIYLVVLLVVVFFTRLTGLEPVLVFGLLIALDYATTSSENDDAEQRDTRLAGSAALVGGCWVLLLGVAAGIAHVYVATHSFADLVQWNQIDVNRAVELAQALDLATIIALELSLVTVIVTIGSLPLMLLPLRMFDGGALWAWNRVVWFATYSAALIAFGLFVAQISPGGGNWWASVAPFLVYAVVALALAAYFFASARTADPIADHREEGSPVQESSSAGK